MADLETQGGGVGLLLGWNALMVLPAIDDYWSDRVDSESVGGQSQWSSECLSSRSISTRIFHLFIQL